MSILKSVVLVLSLIVYIAVGFFTEREDFASYFIGYTALFGGYLYLFRSNINLKWGLFAGLAFRIVLLFSVPNLSDDFYRFFWDGQLIGHGISPFEMTPADWIEAPPADGPAALTTALFESLNSPNYFTIYPPICQYIFGIAASISLGNIYWAVFIMKLFILLFEIGSIFLLISLIRHWQYPVRLIFLYALNPLVILELTGNLHFEAGMLFFVLLAVWFLVKKRASLSAVAMSLAICTKLLPLMFLPFLVKRFLFPYGESHTETLGNRFIKMLQYFSIVGLLSIGLFASILSWGDVTNIFSSIDLYFRSFEFNASIYYVVREIGYWVKGWNIIQIAGPVLGLLTLISILLLAFFEKKYCIERYPRMMLYALSIYFLFANIVHPWYLTPLIALCIFTNFRFPILWSFLISLTYIAYINPDQYQENYYLVGLEYILVFVFIIYEYSCQYQSKKYMDKFCHMEKSCVLQGEENGNENREMEMEMKMKMKMIIGKWKWK